MGVAAPASSAASSVTSPPIQALEQALANLHVGSPDRTMHVQTYRISGVTKVASSNWSGYANDNSSGNSYQVVSGHWTEPTVTCVNSSDLEMAVFWVGLDGFNDATVEQDGTIAVCSSGSIAYYDWWEMYPTNSVQVVKAISAGDTIASSVTYSAGVYKLTVKDVTHPTASFTRQETCAACLNASAEWIAERPSSSTGLLVLPNFGKWRLSNASVTSSGTKGVISTFPADAITMVNGSSQVMVSVGSLNLAGNAFTASWHRSA
jgi:hypothetical protein